MGPCALPAWLPGSTRERGRLGGCSLRELVLHGQNGPGEADPRPRGTLVGRAGKTTVGGWAGPPKMGCYLTTNLQDLVKCI